MISEFSTFLISNIWQVLAPGPRLKSCIQWIVGNATSPTLTCLLLNSNLHIPNSPVSGHFFLLKTDFIWSFGNLFFPNQEVEHMSLPPSEEYIVFWQISNTPQKSFKALNLFFWLGYLAPHKLFLVYNVTLFSSFCFCFCFSGQIYWIYKVWAESFQISGAEKI